MPSWALAAQAGMCCAVGAEAQHSGTSPSFNHTREGMLAPLAELGLSVPGEPPDFNRTPYPLDDFD